VRCQRRNLLHPKIREFNHRNVPRGAPCSNTGERGRCKLISDRDPGGGGDPNGAGGGVLASLGEGLNSAEGVRGRLVPLLYSIASELRVGERNPKREKERYEMIISAEWRYL
jgi:hypothetical protein